jgi:hypothetical protein
VSAPATGMVCDRCGGELDPALDSSETECVACKIGPERRAYAWRRADGLALALREMAVAREYRPLEGALPADPAERRVAVQRITRAHKGTLAKFKATFGERCYEALLVWLSIVCVMAMMTGCSSSPEPVGTHADGGEDAPVETISGSCVVVDGSYECDAGPVVVTP